MKKALVLICVFLMLLSCSCGFFGPQKYVCDLEQVASIRIIRLDKYVEGEYRYEYTVLAEIRDHETFVHRLNNVKHSVNWGDPMQMNTGFIVIRIDYVNQDFDLLHPSAQCFNRSGIGNYGYFFFDSEQFNSLISDYMEE